MFSHLSILATYFTAKPEMPHLLSPLAGPFGPRGLHAPFVFSQDLVSTSSTHIWPSLLHFSSPSSARAAWAVRKMPLATIALSIDMDRLKVPRERISVLLLLSLSCRK
jgi:hypothetical protein